MRNYFLFLLSIFFILTSVSAVRPLTSLFAEQLGASLLEVGLITAFYSLLPIFIAIITGRFIDRFGEKIPLVIGALGSSLSLLLPFLIPELYTLYFCLIILGGSQFLAVVAVQNGLSKLTSARISQEKAIGTFSLFTSLGNTIGPLIGGFASENRGFQETYLILMAVSALSIVCSIFIVQKKMKVTKVENEKQDIKQVLSIHGLKRIMIISMIILAALDLFYVYFPLYASAKGFSPSKIGVVLTFMAFASVIARYFLPIAVHKFGRVRILVIFMLSGAVAYSFVPIFNDFVIIIAIVMLLGAGLGMAQPLTILLSYQLAPENRTAEVLGLRLAGNRLSQVISPIIFAGVSTVIGMAWIFVIEGLLIGIGAFLSLGVKNKEKVIPKKDTS